MIPKSSPLHFAKCRACVWSTGRAQAFLWLWEPLWWQNIRGESSRGMRVTLYTSCQPPYLRFWDQKGSSKGFYTKYFFMIGLMNHTRVHLATRMLKCPWVRNNDLLRNKVPTPIPLSLSLPQTRHLFSLSRFFSFVNSSHLSIPLTLLLPSRGLIWEFCI